MSARKLWDNIKKYDPESAKEILKLDGGTNLNPLDDDIVAVLEGGGVQFSGYSGHASGKSGDATHSGADAVRQAAKSYLSRHLPLHMRARAKRLAEKKAEAEQKTKELKKQNEKQQQEPEKQDAKEKGKEPAKKVTCELIKKMEDAMDVFAKIKIPKKQQSLVDTLDKLAKDNGFGSWDDLCKSQPHNADVKALKKKFKFAAEDSSSSSGSKK